ncbi:MAG: hypothetical protein K9G62_04220 [Alphaproteobacteria bacterium]|nr:hypothetical protein [Alphaproteobacteria bacterium]
MPEHRIYGIFSQGNVTETGDEDKLTGRFAIVGCPGVEPAVIYEMKHTFIGAYQQNFTSAGIFEPGRELKVSFSSFMQRKEEKPNNPLHDQVLIEFGNVFER